MPNISALFQLNLDYLEIFSLQAPIKNYKEISPMKPTMIQANIQPDKYEANWRHCDFVNVHKIHMWQPRIKNHKARFLLRSIKGVKKQCLFCYPPTGPLKDVCTCQYHVILSQTLWSTFRAESIVASDRNFWAAITCKLLLWPYVFLILHFCNYCER